MSDDFDLLETNSQQKPEKVDVNWGKAIDQMKSKLAQEDDPESRQKILNATLDNVVDIRTIGLAAGIELKSRDDGLGKRAYDVFDNCFENNLLTRFTGETIAISPPLIINKDEVKTIFETLRSAILEVD